VKRFSIFLFIFLLFGQLVAEGPGASEGSEGGLSGSRGLPTHEGGLDGLPDGQPEPGDIGTGQDLPGGQPPETGLPGGISGADGSGLPSDQSPASTLPDISEGSNGVESGDGVLQPDISVDPAQGSGGTDSGDGALKQPDIPVDPTLSGESGVDQGQSGTDAPGDIPVVDPDSPEAILAEADAAVDAAQKLADSGNPYQAGKKFQEAANRYAAQFQGDPTNHDLFKKAVDAIDKAMGQFDKVKDSLWGRLTRGNDSQSEVQQLTQALKTMAEVVSDGGSVIAKKYAITEEGEVLTAGDVGERVEMDLAMREIQDVIDRYDAITKRLGERGADTTGSLQKLTKFVQSGDVDAIMKADFVAKKAAQEAVETGPISGRKMDFRDLTAEQFREFVGDPSGKTMSELETYVVDNPIEMLYYKDVSYDGFKEYIQGVVVKGKSFGELLEHVRSMHDKMNDILEKMKTGKATFDDINTFLELRDQLDAVADSSFVRYPLRGLDPLAKIEGFLNYHGYDSFAEKYQATVANELGLDKSSDISAIKQRMQAMVEGLPKGEPGDFVPKDWVGEDGEMTLEMKAKLREIRSLKSFEDLTAEQAHLLEEYYYYEKRHSDDVSKEDQSTAAELSRAARNVMNMLGEHAAKEAWHRYWHNEGDAVARAEALNSLPGDFDVQSISEARRAFSMCMDRDTGFGGDAILIEWSGRAKSPSWRTEVLRSSQSGMSDPSVDFASKIRVADDAKVMLDEGLRSGLTSDEEAQFTELFKSFSDSMATEVQRLSDLADTGVDVKEQVTQLVQTAKTLAEIGADGSVGNRFMDRTSLDQVDSLASRVLEDAHPFGENYHSTSELYPSGSTDPQSMGLIAGTRSLYDCIQAKGIAEGARVWWTSGTEPRIAAAIDVKVKDLTDLSSQPGKAVEAGRLREEIQADTISLATSLAKDRASIERMIQDRGLSDQIANIARLEKEFGEAFVLTGGAKEGAALEAARKQLESMRQEIKESPLMRDYYKKQQALQGAQTAITGSGPTTSPPVGPGAPGLGL
jgi:hypothetical protein